MYSQVQPLSAALDLAQLTRDEWTSLVERALGMTGRAATTEKGAPVAAGLLQVRVR